MTGVPRVLMVTGAYFPETSGAGLQCRTLVAALGPAADVTVLSTTTNRTLLSEGSVDGTRVHRIFVNPRSLGSVAMAAAKFIAFWLRSHSLLDIVHLHGFSMKSVLTIILAKLSRKPVVLKMTSVGHDDPVTAQGWGPLSRWCFHQAVRLVGVSPRFADLSREAGVPPGRFMLIPNGVDLKRFRPSGAKEKRTLRATLALPEDVPLVLFVGFFSEEKGPEFLFDAWIKSRVLGSPDNALVFIGATRSPYYEVDASIAGRIKGAAARNGVGSRVHFVERADAIEEYYRCADVFVLPSRREGMPNALLEAMASGVACIANRLPGVTDWMLEDGVSGILVPPGDAASLARALHRTLSDLKLRKGFADRSSQRAASLFSIQRSATLHRALYQEVLTA